MEEYTEMLREYLREERNIDKTVFKIAGRIYRGVNNGRFTFDEVLAKINRRTKNAKI